MTELIKEKVQVVAVHAAITLLVAGCVAALIFFFWFPHPLELMVGGLKLFALILGCDLILGPLVSFVIYNPNKSRREMALDYSFVAVIQVAALLYGVVVVAQSRPVFVVFLKDRLEVITALELDDADFAEVKDAAFKSRPWLGPELAAVQLPADAGERVAVFMSALSGKDASSMPKYYRPYDSMIGAIQERLGSVRDLIQRMPDQQQDIESAVRQTGLGEGSVGWLPVQHRFGFWLALVDKNTGRPIRYLPIDPY